MIDQKTILKMAQLARLKISSEEADLYGDQLSKVLSHFQKISSLDTKGIEPLVTPVEIDVFLREDIVRTENTAEEIVFNAPDKAGNLFKVPPVV